MNYLCHEYRIRQKFHLVSSVLSRTILYQVVISSAFRNDDDHNMNMYLRIKNSFGSRPISREYFRFSHNLICMDNLVSGIFATAELHIVVNSSEKILFSHARSSICL